MSNTGNSTVNLADPRDRTIAAQIVVSVLDGWQIRDADKAVLLGLSNASAGALEKYRSGSKALAHSTERLERVGNLLSINESLRTLYKFDGDGAAWLARPNLLCNKLSPIEYMLQNGAKGIYFIRSLLERRLNP